MSALQGSRHQPLAGAETGISLTQILQLPQPAMEGSVRKSAHPSSSQL